MKQEPPSLNYKIVKYNYLLISIQIRLRHNFMLTSKKKLINRTGLIYL